MVGIRYDVSYDATAQASSVNGLSSVALADTDIQQYAKITAGRDPILYDLSAVDEYRTEEAKVPAGSFLIVDTTGATYGKVQEDTRKGISCECIGIVPVVTTAANAIYAQQLIQAGLGEVSAFETLGGTALKTLKTDDYSNGGLLASDLDKLLNTNGYYVEVTTQNIISSFTAYFPVSAEQDEVEASANEWLNYTDPDAGILKIYLNEGTALSDVLVSTQLGPADIEDAQKFVPVSADNMDDFAKWSFQANVSCSLSEDDPRYGWHNPQGDDAVPETMALDANNWFSTIQPAEDGEGFDPTHLKDVGVIVYKMYLDASAGNKVSYEPVEAYCGSLCKEDKDPNTGVTKFLDTIINSQSKYINFFSNVFNDTKTKKAYKDDIDILWFEPSEGAVLGLYSPMTAEDISISKSIYDGINKSFEKVSDINKLAIDIVLDGGVSNIASYLKAIYGDKGKYDLMVTDDLGNSLLGLWKADSATSASTKTWKTVV